MHAAFVVMRVLTMIALAAYRRAAFFQLAHAPAAPFVLGDLPSPVTLARNAATLTCRAANRQREVAPVPRSCTLIMTGRFFLAASAPCRKGYSSMLSILVLVAILLGGTVTPHDVLNGGPSITTKADVANGGPSVAPRDVLNGGPS